MSLLAVGWIASATACMVLALLQAVIWLKRRRVVAHLLFSVAAVSAAGLALAEMWMSQATTVEQYLRGFKASNYCVAVLIINLAWFVIAYAEVEQRLLAWVATVTWLLGAALNATRPAGLALSEIQGLDQRATFWGDAYTLAALRLDWSKVVVDVGVIAFLLLAVQASVSCWRDGRHRRAALLGSLAAFMGLALVHTTLVDLGYLRSPYLISYAFLAIVLVTGYELASRVASAAALSVRIRDDERRWRSLLEGVELLVARIRSDGIIEYVNPHFRRVSGYSEGELLGRPVRTFIPDLGSKLEMPERDTAVGEHVEPTYQASLLTKQQTRRDVIWREVPFQSAAHKVPEVLVLGADVTARLAAERDRDDAIAEIATLKAQLEEENLYLKEQIKQEGEFSDIVGESKPIKYVLFRIEQVATTDTTVLIQGETGVGKELVARAIHDRSHRSEAAFVRLNCAALPPNLVESELFGHVAGAFTDAKGSRIGRFELADGGTLFLDEISELPLEIQPKLLRVLEDGEFEPVGSSESRTADVRLIAATNRNLEEQIESGGFRQDLFYRLHVYPITVPTLRERKDDIPLLIEHFLPRISSRVGKTIAEVPAAVMRALQAYAWPGNVRQLQNTLEESVVLSDDGILRLPPHFNAAGRRATAHKNDLRSLAELEREHIRSVLASTNGQIAGRGGAAEILAIHPNTLRSRMKRLELSAKDLTSKRADPGS